MQYMIVIRENTRDKTVRCVMDRFDYRVSRYDGAILFLPQTLRDPAGWF